MKNTCLIIFLTAIIGLFSFSVQGEDATAQLGKKLFNDPTLGGSSNPNSCSFCHPNGKGLETAGSITNIGEMINRCIEKALQGNKIDNDSVEMKSLILYIKSLEK